MDKLRTLPKLLLFRVFVICLLMLGGATLLHFSSLGQLLRDTIQQRLNFVVRSQLGRTPSLSSNIKIYAFDDQTTGVLQKHDLRLKDWRILLNKINARNPKAVFIDKVWSLPIGNDFDRPVDLDEGKSFVDELGEVATPIAVGGSVFEHAIPRRLPVSVEAPVYDLQKYLAPGETAPEWLYARKGMFYGPHLAIKNAFKLIGQLDSAGYGSVYPFIRVDHQRVIPHSALLAANLPIVIDKGELFVGGKRVGVDDSGRLSVNLSDVSVYQEGIKTRSLISAILRLNRGEELTEIKPGDYVAVLPAMFTGNTDWTSSPVGKIQGGYLPVAMLNSAISGRWLIPIGHDLIIILLLMLVGTIGFLVLPLRAVLPATIGSAIAWTCFGLYLFSFYDVMFPWLMPALAITFQGVAVFAERARWSEMQKGRLRQALEDTVPPERLEKLIQPGVIKRDATEQVVTVMFIDIVGFSLQAERLTPNVAFRDLRQNLSKMTEVIHQHGGIIDKFLGDGLLCFFGYSFTGGRSSVHGHADEAVSCALAIQKEWARWGLDLGANQRAIYPLRIGINTASAYIGDVGRGHIHFTLIGEGVNFAKRLEAACEPYKVMVGAATKDLLKLQDFNWESVHERPIQIKHHQELFQSFEIDPFHEDEGPLLQIQDAIRRTLTIDRVAQRWPVPEGKLWVDFGIGSGEISNYSGTGFGIIANVYPATGVKLTLNIEASDPRLNHKLKQSGLFPVICEVRWGCPIESGEKYRLGVLAKSLNPLQLELLNEILRNGLFYEDQEEAA